MHTRTHPRTLTHMHAHTQAPNYTTLECPANKVRSIVGSKGATIQQIRAQTGVRVDIDNDCVPGSNPPVQLVRFSGHNYIGPQRIGP